MTKAQRLPPELAQEIPQETRPTVELIPAPPIFQPRTELQITARALYMFGWNVFPVPRPHEVRAWAMATGRESEATAKPPYTLRPLLRSRMYLGNSAEFMDLFEYANLAVMTGRTSGNLAVIDADQNGQKIAKELSHRAIPHWDYTTGNGHNFIVRIAEGEAMNLPSGKTAWPGVEVWGHDHFCVLPPSIHHTGAIYNWGAVYPPDTAENLPEISITALAWLGVELAANSWERPELYGLPEWTIQLSINNRKTLASVLVEGQRNTRLTAPVYDIAWHVLNGNIPESEALSLLYRVADRCDPAYPHRQVEAMYSAALRKRDLEPARKTEGQGRGHPIGQQALAFAQANQWTGRTAQSDRAAFLACVERAKIEGEPFAASVRQVAELANCSTKTAHKALGRLQDKEPPLIELESMDRDRIEANRYRFGPIVKKKEHAKVLHNTTIVTSVVDWHVLKSDSACDVFGKLGRVARRLYLHLSQQPEARIIDMARATGQHPSSCSRSLRRLRGHNLITYNQAEGVYMAEPITEYRLLKLAEALGVRGRTRKRREQNIADRQIRVNKQLRWARERWRRSIDLAALPLGARNSSHAR
jgi:hypothetical protein